MKTREARDVMSRNVVTTGGDVKLLEAMKLLLDKDISGLPVVSSGNELAGMLTEHDIMNFAFSGDADSTFVKEAMSTEILTFSPDANLYSIVNCFATHRIRRVPIVENGKVVGIVSRQDILREMLSMYGVGE